MLHAECVIIGAGFAGAATAFELTRRGIRDVVILEKEPAPGYHASGRSAAMVRSIVSDEPVAAVARAGAAFLRGAGELWSLPELFRPRGALLLGSGDAGRRLLADAEAARRAGLDVAVWDAVAVDDRIELARGGPSRGGVFCKDDGTVDARLLLRSYLAAAEALGARLLASQTVEGIDVAAPRSEVRAVRTRDLEIRTPRVVNAAGAWAARIGALAGAPALPISPFLRHMTRGTPAAGCDPGAPYVWDVEHGAYFRPDGSDIIACACDAIPDEPGDASPTASGRAELDAKLARVFPAIRWSRREFWAGHRTYTPDQRFVIGADPRIRGLFWAAGLGGHGVTTSAAIGALVADAVLGGGGAGLGGVGLGGASGEPSPFSPARFQR